MKWNIYFAKILLVVTSLTLYDYNIYACTCQLNENSKQKRGVLVRSIPNHMWPLAWWSWLFGFNPRSLHLFEYIRRYICKTLKYHLNNIRSWAVCPQKAILQESWKYTTIYFQGSHVLIMISSLFLHVFCRHKNNIL